MKRLLKSAAVRWLLALAAALLFYALAGFFLVPFLVRHYTPKLTAELIQRQASIGEVRFNPFLFTFEAHDFALMEADGQPILELGRLFLDFEPTEYFEQRALVFTRLSLEKPSINLVLEQDGKANLAKIADSLPKSEEPPPPPSGEPPPAVVLKEFRLSEGVMKFTDLAKDPPLGLILDQLHLELDNLTTLPDRAGSQRFAAGLPDGGRLAWKGDVSLNPIATSGELQIEAFKLANGWQFIRDRMNLAEPGGEIGLSANYRFAYSKDKTDLAIADAKFELKGLKLALADAKSPLLELEEIGFDQASVDLAGQTVKVPSVYIRKGKISATMDEHGSLDWLNLTKPVKSTSSSPAPTVKTTSARPKSAPAQPWKLAIEDFEIAGIGLQFLDFSRKAPLQASVGDFGLKLAAEAEAGADEPKARVDKFSLHLDRVGLDQPARQEHLFGWDSFSLEDGRLDLEKREIALQRAVIRGGDTSVIRQSDGSLYPLELFAAQGGDTQPAPAPETADQPGQDWTVRLGEFALQGFRFAITDRSWAPEVAYNLDDIQISAKNISSDGKSPVNFDTRLKVRQGGGLQISGTASASGDSAKAKIKLDRLDLKPLQPVVSQFAKLKLESADVSSEMSVDFRQAEPKPSMKAVGGVSVNALSLRETQENKRFLAWKTLAVNGIDLSLGPDRLKVKEVRIVEPYSVIAIAKDKSTNFDAIAKPQKSQPKTMPVEARPAVKAAKQRLAKEEPFPVSIARVVVERGFVDFSDMSLVLPFATRIHDFGGAVAGFSLNPSDRATMKFDGRVNDYGEVQVYGGLSPLDPKAFSDIQVVFRNVAMNSLSPYSATFAGRRIQSGKLNLDLLYKIENSRLKSENRIVLENFTLGPAVESPNSTSLPLDLAVALLTDSEGRIKASVPIEGNVDDPQFAYGTVIWDAFVTLITKAATAPFNAIASVFGGSEKKFDAVMFESGRDDVPPPEREKLHRVAEAMSRKPKLKLIVHGRFDPNADGEALKSLAVRRDLAKKLDVALAPGEEPDAVAFGNADTEKALEELALARGGPRVLDGLQTEYIRETGKPAQRVGFLSGLTGRGSETPDFYERVFKYLVDNQPLPQAELNGLADRRGKAVIEELIATGKFDRARLVEGPIESTEATEAGSVPTRLELGAE